MVYYVGDGNDISTFQSAPTLIDLRIANYHHVPPLLNIIYPIFLLKIAVFCVAGYSAVYVQESIPLKEVGLENMAVKIHVNPRHTMTP